MKILQSFIQLFFIGILVCWSSALKGQQRQWYLFQENDSGLRIQFSDSSNPKVVPSIQLINPNNNAPFEDYLSINTQSDEDGNILFYIITTLDSVYIFNSENEYFWGTPFQGGKYDIAPLIVPLPGGLRFHIYIGDQLYNLHLRELISLNAENFEGSPLVSVRMTKIDEGPHDVTYIGRRAVKVLYAGCDSFVYRLFSVSANEIGYTGRYIYAYDIVAIGNEIKACNLVGSLELTDNTNSDIDFHYSVGEVEISPNKDELVLTGRNCLLRLDISQNNFQSYQKACFYNNEDGIDSGYFFCGAEYLNDSQILFSLYQTDDSSSQEQGLYLYNSWDGSFNYVPGSLDFKYSHIERGIDGYLYAVKSDGLYRYVLDSNAMVNILSFTVSPTLPFVNLSTGELSQPQICIYSLPPLIDHLSYQSLDDYNNITRGVLIKSPPLQETQLFTNQNHGLTPLGNGTIVVLDSMIITNIADWVIFDSLTVQFAQDAFLRIIGGADLELRGTTLMGTCGEMWKGVEMVQNDTHDSHIVCRKNNSGRNTLIRDALIGVKTRNFYHSVIVYDSTVFTANLIGLELNNSNSYFSNISNTYFYDTVILNNGQYSSCAIEVQNSNLKLGHTDSLPIVILGGQNGLLCKSNTSILLENIYVKNSVQDGVLIFDSDSVSISNVNIKDCGSKIMYHSGLAVKNFEHCTMKHNVIAQNNDCTGVKLEGGVGSHTLIGGLTKSDSNMITVNNAVALHYVCYTNKHYSNFRHRNFEYQGRPLVVYPVPLRSLLVQNNRIHSAYGGTGIEISNILSNSTDYKKFDSLSIWGNYLESGVGIIMDNIVAIESNSLLPMRSELLNGYSNRHVNNNHIVLLDSIGLFTKSGIEIKLSDHIYCVDNEIRSKYCDAKFTNNCNAGITSVSSTNILVHNNTLSNLNRGVVVDKENYFSNLYCNTHMNNLNCIYLNNSKLRLSPIIPIIPFDRKIHGNKEYSLYYNRSSSFLGLSSYSSIFHNDNLSAIQLNYWIMDSVDRHNPKLYSNNSKAFVYATPGLNICSMSRSIPSNLDSLAELENVGILNDTCLDFWSDYLIAKFNLENGLNSGPSNFVYQILNIENLIDTGDLNALGTAISNLQPVTGIESRIAYVFDQWYKYVSQYDTVFYGSDSFQHIQIWVNDSTYFYNSIIIDTADFRVHYRPLADTVFLKIYSLALSSPFKYDPAAKFGRNFLMFAGYLMTYYDTAEFELPPLSGRVTPACSGGGVDGIPVKLFFGNGAPTGLETVTIEDGYFRFSPLDLVKLDTSSDYYIRVYFPLDSNHISVTASLNHLIFDSLVNIDCTFPGPIPLSNGTIYDTAFKLFPNPTDGNIRLEYLGGAWVTDYVCYNIFGQAVLSGLISAENNEIDFNDYSIPDGYYIMKIIGNQTIKPVSIPLVIYRK